MEEERYVYNRRYEGNILVLGQTEYGKTCFVQRLAVNNVFGKLKEVEWISVIDLKKPREAEIESCFKLHSLIP